MPVFAPIRLDTLGNPVDGYEVNDSRSVRPDIYLPPDFTDQEVVEALVEADILRSEALKFFADEELVVETGGQDLELLDRESAWAVNDQYVEMVGYLRDEPLERRRIAEHEGVDVDEVVEVEGFRPFLALSEVYDEEPNWKQLGFETFWKREDDEFAMVRMGKGRPPTMVTWSSDGINEYTLNHWNAVVNSDSRLPRDQGTFLAENAAELAVALDHFMETGEVSQAVSRK